MESQSMIYIVSEYASQGEIFGESLQPFPSLLNVKVELFPQIT